MKTYQQHCGVARSLDLLGGRWTLLIVRELLLGPTRYSALLGGLRGITTNLLADRLQALQAGGLVERCHDVDDAPAWRLTPLGEGLEPALMELARFGQRLAQRPGPHDRVELGWALLSIKRRYRGGDGRVVELRAGEQVFALTLLPAYLRVRRHAATAPQLVVTAAAEHLLAVLMAGADPAPLLARGAIVVAGEAGAWEELLGAFSPTPLPGTPGPDPEPGTP